MSPPLPRISAAEAARALEKAGFQLLRQSGSHRIYRNAAGLRVTLPYQGLLGTELGPLRASSFPSRTTTTKGMQASPALHALRRVTSRHPGMGGIPCL